MWAINVNLSCMTLVQIIKRRVQKNVLNSTSLCGELVGTWLLCLCVKGVLPVEMVMFSSKEQCAGFTLLWTKPLSEVLTFWTAVQGPRAALNYQVKDITEPTHCFTFILCLTQEVHHICPFDCPSFLQRTGWNHRSSEGFVEKWRSANVPTCLLGPLLLQKNWNVSSNENNRLHKIYKKTSNFN